VSESVRSQRLVAVAESNASRTSDILVSHESNIAGSNTKTNLCEMLLEKAKNKLLHGFFDLFTLHAIYSTNPLLLFRVADDI